MNERYRAADFREDDEMPEMGGAWWQSDRDPPRSPPPPPIKAKPFVWRDPKTFPRRQWLYGHHLIRRFLSCTVAPGGVGKSSLVLVEAVAMATGRDLLGVQVHQPLRVWVFNLEDPLEETERRVIAICLHFGIDPAELDGRLFLNSGRDTSLVIASTTRSGTQIAQPVVDALKAEILARKVDVVVIDPLVKAHRVPENDNGAIDMVCTTIAGIADETGCAFDLVHHVRKTNGAEVTVEDGRGAVALLSASRSARALNRMTKDEAEKAGVEDPKLFFRAETGKANLAPADKADWFKLVPVSLGNGDSDLYDNSDRVAVAETWTWPDALADLTVADLLAVQKKIAAGRYRENSQAREWVGRPIAEVLRLDLNSRAHQAKVKSLLKTWMGSGALVTVEGTDEKREKRTFVEVGQWATN